MSQHPNRRLDTQTILADQTAMIAVQNFTDYNPNNPLYTKAALAEKQAKLDAARAAEIHAQNELYALRDAATTAEWEYHQAVLGLKDQVIAQYGSDSDQVRSLGLKKKSDRKRPAMRVRATEKQA